MRKVKVRKAVTCYSLLKSPDFRGVCLPILPHLLFTFQHNETWMLCPECCQLLSLRTCTLSWSLNQCSHFSSRPSYCLRYFTMLTTLTSPGLCSLTLFLASSHLWSHFSIFSYLYVCIFNSLIFLLVLFQSLKWTSQETSPGPYLIIHPFLGWLNHFSWFQ